VALLLPTHSTLVHKDTVLVVSLPTTVGTVEPSLSAVGVAMRDPTKAQLRLLCVPTKTRVKMAKMMMAGATLLLFPCVSVGWGIRDVEPSPQLLGITARGGGSASNLDADSQNINGDEQHELVQVQIIHRHGDRTPVTPLHNRSYWENTLPQDAILEKIAEGINLVRHENSDPKGYSHSAAGGRPYGQLTLLGLLQMMELGTRLRDELSHDAEKEKDQSYGTKREQQECEGYIVPTSRKLFTPDKPLHPDRIKVRSTDFPRTIQSVQALLVGLFPDGLNVHQQIESAAPISMDIDVRHTKYHIPDPHPRNSEEQEDLEKELARREHLVDRERDMVPLAKKVTYELMRQGVLQDAQAALEVSSGFNVGEVNKENPAINAAPDVLGVEDMHNIQPLPWGQLAEITKCLKVRDLLHPTICSSEEQDQIMDHASWRWFETLRNPRVSQLAMTPMMTDIVHNALEMAEYCDNIDADNANVPLLHIYSGHDSTLIGLMCVFQLDKPASWPPYGSYLKIELLRSTDPISSSKNDFFVRFSLNGETLRCHLHENKSTGGPSELVPLDVLQSFLHQAHLETEEHLLDALKTFKR
jgi:hypothetical protein